MNEESHKISEEKQIQTHTAVHADAKHQEPENEGGLLTINGTLPVIMISFILFAFIMQRVLYGPLSTIKRKREEYIEKNKSDAKAAEDEAINLTNDYHSKLKDARKNASAITAKAIKTATDEKNSILENKKTEVNDFLKTQKEKIQQDKDSAVDSLKSQVAEYAQSITAKILGEEVSIAGLTPEIIDKALNRQ